VFNESTDPFTSFRDVLTAFTRKKEDDKEGESVRGGGGGGKVWDR